MYCLSQILNKAIETLVKKPITATGSNAIAAGQAKFQSCSTRFPAMQLAYKADCIYVSGLEIAQHQCNRIHGLKDMLVHSNKNIQNWSEGQWLTQEYK